MSSKVYFTDMRTNPEIGNMLIKLGKLIDAAGISNIDFKENSQQSRSISASSETLPTSVPTMQQS